MPRVKILMIGDVIGGGGLTTLEEKLPPLIAAEGAALTIVNGENSAGGFGVTAESLTRLFKAGADAVTGGNHTWEKREAWPVLESESRSLRPANYPPPAVGRGFTRIEKEGVAFVVINLQGREFMTAIDSPFTTFDKIYQNEKNGAEIYRNEKKTKTIFAIDFHAESVREKEALAYYVDGRASLLAGTHTHVQTADERILPGGTGYITDLGMTGPKDSVIGMDPKICIDRSRTQVLYRMEEAAPGENILQGLAAEIDTDTGAAVSLKRLNI